MLALSFKVTNKLMNELEHHHINGAPKLRLGFGLDGKRRWEVISPKILSPEYERRMSKQGIPVQSIPILSLESKNTGFVKET